MSLKDIFKKKNNTENELLSEEDLNSNEFYVEEPKKKSYSKFRYMDKKKLISYGAAAIIILVLLIGGIVKFLGMSKEERDSLFDIGNLLNQEAVEKNEEQQAIHSLILRNSAWGSSMDDVAIEERGNLIDYGDNYLTCDYETLFNLTWLPTYLFKDNKLVAILYEANLSQSNLDELSSLHQDVAVNIHYVYEQLYRENNKWATGQPRKYDKNLWTKSILNGKLTMQSVWNSSNEKIFLVTNNKPLFGFLSKIRGITPKAYMAFIIVSDDYLLTNDFNALMDIKPSSKAYGDFYNAGEQKIELVPADEVNIDTQVDATTNYTETAKPEDISDEEFEAILNELYGNTEEGTRVDMNGNIIDKDGKVIGNIDGTSGSESSNGTSGSRGTTMNSSGTTNSSTGNGTSSSNRNSTNSNTNSSSSNSTNSSADVVNNGDVDAQSSDNNSSAWTNNNTDSNTNENQNNVVGNVNLNTKNPSPVTNPNETAEYDSNYTDSDTPLGYNEEADRTVIVTDGTR